MDNKTVTFTAEDDDADDAATDESSDFDELSIPESEDIPNSENYDQNSAKRIPYMKVYEPPVPFTNCSPYIPGYSVTVSITDAIYSPDNHYFNPFLYVIEVYHGKFQWKIKRRYSHFVSMHQQLQVHRAALSIPFPTKKHRERRKSMSTSRKVYPRFPRKPDALVSPEHIERRIEQLQTYLQQTLDIEVYRKHHAMMTFLEISPLSFVSELGHKGKEGVVRKRAGGHNKGSIWSKIRSRFLQLIQHWRRRWLVAKDSYIVYFRPRDGTVREVILIDHEFHVAIHSETFIRIHNLSRELTVNCWTKRRAAEWSDYLNEVGETLAKDFIEPHRYESFAPVRPETTVHFFVDGCSYFDAVAEALKKAEQEVFITDWWFSPEVYTKRPVIHGDSWRLDKVLQSIAEKGVRVFVLLYKEVELALGINSLYSKQRLMRLHPNIRVLRHPDPMQGVWFWSHHEKLVVIDQSYAFVGGIDLCYGRWDTWEHRLIDVGSARRDSSKDVVDYGTMSKNLAEQFTENKKKNEIKRETSGSLYPRSRKLSLKRRAQRAFKKVTAANALARLNNYNSVDSLDASLSDSEEIPLKPEELGLRGGAIYWIGKDYVNFIIKDFVQLDQLYESMVDRQTIPRMPWHDVSLMVQGAAARDVARHFILRWNFTKKEKAKYYDKYPWLFPKSYKKVDKVRDLKFMGKGSKASCQIVRSLSSWSGGIKVTEVSIHKAYVDIIHNAKYFIYIENQFFVTQSTGRLGVRDSPVMNEIGEALYYRIIRAYRNKETFRVYVVLPLLPAFEGEIGTSKGTALQAVTHWNMVSICRGGDSLLERLRKEIRDPTDYICFCSLRNYGDLNGKLVSELVYVHSKLLIADDMVTIIGSANINDRSMIGSRDSEVAVVVTDTETEPSCMGEKAYRSGTFSGSLRRYLFQEHLGLLGKTNPRVDVRDPIPDKFYKNVWLATAANNTRIYETVFNVIPSDDVSNFAELRSRQKQTPLAATDDQAARNLIESVSGHLVLYPMFFLSNEDIQPATGTKESLVPATVWI